MYAYAQSRALVCVWKTGTKFVGKVLVRQVFAPKFCPHLPIPFHSKGVKPVKKVLKKNEKIKQKQPIGRRMKSDIGGAISYLTHRNAPDKHQYDDSEVVAQQGYDWQAVRAKSEALQAENKSYRNVLTKIEQGEIRRYNLMDNVSMAMYMTHKLDFERAFEYREAKLKSNPNRKIDVIYISGDPGAGKTTLAKQLCEKRGLSYCLSGSTRDPVQDYDGQDALILDDLRPEAFPLSDLLKLLDNNSNSSVSARYHDRWLEVKLIIVTTVLSIQRFHELYCNPSEPVEQLMRQMYHRHRPLYFRNVCRIHTNPKNVNIT